MGAQLAWCLILAVGVTRWGVAQEAGTRTIVPDSAYRLTFRRVMVANPEQFGKIVAVPIMIRIVPKERLQIMTQADWEEFWRQRVDRDYGVKAPPPVDFSRDMVVVATLGKARGCDWWIRIDSLVYSAGRTNVFVTGGRPPVAKVCGPYHPWQPWDAVWVPRSTMPILWHERIVPTP